MNQEYLLDKDFLKQLDEYPHKEKFARIISLDFDENQLEEIQGKVTSGSINIDGSSAVRRTCSLSMVAKNVNINDFYWGLNTKFKLEIGLVNEINNKYPEICWFKQGTFLITSFSCSLSNNSYTISISGKDKMAMLNGDIGGTVNSLSWDFGTEDYTDNTTGVVTNKDRLIKNIIRDAVQEYAHEPLGRIIVNDLDGAAVELMEYRGKNPLYLYITKEGRTCTQVTLDGNQKVYSSDVAGGVCTISELEENGLKYDNCVNLNLNGNEAEGSIVYMSQNSSTEYTIAKVVSGQTAGYRSTDLTYAGDLILSTGESITSMLDKIVKMLGEYEYFYDLDGNFVFQRKKIYVNTTFNNIVDNREETYVENASQTSAVQYSFRDNNLIGSIQNTPNLNNLKNDYSI